MNKSRLLKLADLLEADAENEKGIRFGLAYWGWTDIVVSTDETPEKIPVDCQTTACAVGLACISGVFKRAGLGFDITSRARGGGNNFTPTFKRSRGIGAVGKFFALGGKEFNYLFTDGAYDPLDTMGARGERAVAARIRDFVAGKAAP